MKALKLFKLILNSSSHLNHFTFSTVLDACAGYSAVLVGNQVHACMLMSSCWPPLLTCMLNVETLKLLSAFLGQSLQEIRSLEVMQTWACRCLRGCWRVVSGLGALLGLCRMHSCLELGEIAANGIYTLEHNHPAIYSVLSKIHGDKGVCSDITSFELWITWWRNGVLQSRRLVECLSTMRQVAFYITLSFRNY